MKIILGSVSSGKSLEVASRAAQYSKEGKNVRIISNEQHMLDYSKKVLNDETANLSNLSVNYRPYQIASDSIGYILSDVVSEVIFLDMPLYNPDVNKGVDKPTVVNSSLDMLLALESHTGKEIYVVVQTNRAHPDKGIRITEYKGGGLSL